MTTTFNSAGAGLETSSDMPKSAAQEANEALAEYFKTDKNAGKLGSFSLIFLYYFAMVTMLVVAFLAIDVMAAIVMTALGGGTVALVVGVVLIVAGYACVLAGLNKIVKWSANIATKTVKFFTNLFA